MKEFVQEIKILLEKAREKVYAATSYTMIECYWEIGRRIVEKEQQGQNRATYGKEVLQNLSNGLGTGFSTRTLRDMRKCYLTFPEWKDLAHACAKLEWSHIRTITRVIDVNARKYYLKEAAEQNWGVRRLERNINTLYYQRLVSSTNKQPVIDEMVENIKDIKPDSRDFIRNPTVLEFLNIPTNRAYTERQLEQLLIDNLQQFLLELGKGFAFVARQKYIRTETTDFFIDLVFYNYILKCFVVIELKTDKITHQDIGQLDMYVRMFDDLERKEDDNPTIGLLLCTETDRTIAKYSVLNENKQLFASKYLPYLPSEEELEAEIEREKNVLREQGVVYGEEE
ncbi:PDDEXK nuclease domain-containing protein [Sphingobacterium yanglingense]|uniref:Putative nuclease of restriction endonuclease-like (RecB) superfamily n=1 Tax=Sphingobacterium yanglingense TaxID=1437280 RepID=A0A4R6WK93_9SPHI|nr:PDDEXK nuclease domain-containing protein [Sphingobacterium yanglingense]TDQ79188.1 putative nuclease of restriction endonuclease-like (RecB) superfamily [Sphingobacterium yanglingense]